MDDVWKVIDKQAADHYYTELVDDRGRVICYNGQHSMSFPLSTKAMLDIRDAMNMQKFIKAELTRLREANNKLAEALELLHSVQNGAPLIKYEYEWNDAMAKTKAALAKLKGNQMSKEIQE